MPTITGIFRNGRVELDEPLPDWANGSAVTVLKPDTATDEIDITGDSPEAIAAWTAWYEDFSALPRNEIAANELEQILAVRKDEQKTMVSKQNKCIDGLFP